MVCFPKILNASFWGAFSGNCFPSFLKTRELQVIQSARFGSAILKTKKTENFGNMP